MENSKISWCDHTFNPWIGCMKVNEACKFCYAEVMDKRFSKQPHWGPGTDRQIMSEKYWNQPVNWNKAAGRAGIKLRVFCASLADVFEDHPQISDSRIRLFELIEQTPNLIWMLLTKRPENILGMIPDKWITHGVCDNVRFGVSIGMQSHFDKFYLPMESAMWKLSNAREKVKYFYSMEPLIGPVDMKFKFNEKICGDAPILPSYIITGGESGHGARPMHVDWVESILKQCQEFGIKFHFKQWGEHQLGSEPLSKKNIVFLNDGKWHDHTSEGIKIAQKLYTHDQYVSKNPNVMCRVGKERAGDVLYGKRYKDLID